MNNTRIEYSKRLHEVEVYFDTLKLLDNGSCSIKCVDILGVETIKTIDSELLPREKEIIYLRYGLFGRKAYTQREVAKKLSISRSYVSRIEKKALDTLKEKIKN